MPQQKLKSENYVNLGGINSKASQYLTGPHEFLDLRNFDFSTPGALTGRWGSTQYIGAISATKVTGLYEYEQTGGFSQILFSLGTTLYAALPAGTTAIDSNSNWTNTSFFDFSTYFDKVFYANGIDFKKYNGTFPIQNYSLPDGPAGLSLGASYTTTDPDHPYSGFFSYSVGYLNSFGFYGHARAATYLVGTSFGGATHIWVNRITGITLPASATLWGITAIVIYRNSVGLNDQLTSSDRIQRSQLAVMPIGTTFFEDYGAPLNLNYIGLTSVIFGTNNYGLWGDGSPEPTAVYFTLAPKYTEIYNNQLFLSGFSALPSRVYFSEIGQPESVDPANFFDVRTNDGDKLTAIRSYLSQVVLFKERSCHKIHGDDPDNFVLSQITDEYGCLNNRSVVVWQDRMWFLDRKGICEYVGANINIVSNKIQPIFERMNLDAARTEACAVHFKERNEVWFAIPVDGSSTNNITVVFDYVAGGWSFFEGFQPAVFARARGRLTNPTVMYGGYTGLIYDFGASFFADNGSGISFVAKTRFLHDLGNSSQSQFRRLWMDADVPGLTTFMNVNFYQDYGSSVVANATFQLANFQNRIDYGVNARSMGMEFGVNGASMRPRMYGYSIDYRLIRRV